MNATRATRGAVNSRSRGCDRNFSGTPRAWRQAKMTTPTSSHILYPIVAFALVASACGKSADQGGGDNTNTAVASSPSATPGNAAAKEAQQIFVTRCAVCHGEGGQGDGPGAAALNPKPRNYTDKAWQASVTDAELKEVIVKGGLAVGKSATMAPNPDLGSPAKTEVLFEMVKLVRSFGK
jgi:mono/diheme cytochrome c family protein